jgi:hypothetical protein
MLSVTFYLLLMLNVIMLTVIILTVVMLTVVMLTVIMLSVIGPILEVSFTIIILL